jgi:hypothetical protein
MLAEVDVECRFGSWREVVLGGHQIFRLCDYERPFSNEQGIDRNVASHEVLPADRAALYLIVITAVGTQMLEALWRYVVADLFVHFPNHAFEKRFVALTMAAKQSDLSREYDVRDHVTPLKQKTAMQIDEDSAANFAVP